MEKAKKETKLIKTDEPVEEHQFPFDVDACSWQVFQEYKVKRISKEFDDKPYINLDEDRPEVKRNFKLEM